MEDTSRVAAVVVGVITLHFEGCRVLVLHDCLYVPSVRRNLISVSSLSCHGYSFLFNKNYIFIKYDDKLICVGMLIDNLYLVEPIAPMQINSHEYNHKRKEMSSVNQTQLWHLRLGHINLERIRRMVTSGLINPLDVITLPVCEPCLEDKITMRPFKAKGNRAKEVLDLVHTNLCGPMSTNARGGYKYFITFIDDYSGYGYI